MFGEKVKILIIDDKPENLHAMKVTLQPLEDVEIYTALSGNEGLSLMLEHEFAVVLLDVQMPEMDGFETATLMQSHSATRNIPIIFVTAINKEDMHVFKGYESGAVDYLFKPLNLDILLSKIKVFIRLFKQRKECEQMQREIQKIRNIEALGVLAGGIAHDFNNLLAAFFNNIELAKLKCDKDSPIRNNLDSALKAVQRAKNLTQQLVTFAKGGAPMKISADIVDLLNDTTTLILSGTNIKIDIDSTPPIPKVDIDRGQIDQVFQNLIQNAKEAMPNGGTLSIKFDTIEVENDNLTPYVSNGKYVRVTFQDNGPGMDETVLARIFDPYFSTKKKGKERGHGLGLTISLSIMKKHGGYIQAESERGKGSVFHLYFPISTDETKSVPVIPDQEKTIATDPVQPALKPGAKKKILILEDEEAVSMALIDMLDYLGYEAISGANGKEALALCSKANKENKPFDAAILDLTIRGGEGGEKILEKLLKINPELKAIVASGYSENPVMSNFSKYGFADAISKPYSLEELVAALKKLDVN